MASNRPPWTYDEMYDFVIWHDSTLTQYPYEIREELKQVRRKWISGIKIKNENSIS